VRKEQQQQQQQQQRGQRGQKQSKTKTKQPTSSSPSLRYGAKKPPPSERGVQVELRCGRDTLKLTIGCDPEKVVQHFCDLNGCPERYTTMVKSMHTQLTKNYERLPPWQKDLLDRIRSRCPWIGR
jgi:hypothetical protein